MTTISPTDRDSYLPPTALTSPAAPLHPQAVLLPLISFPSWILCVPSLVWQFRQGNIATGSLILWVALTNFFLSVNSLIWPRDNLYEWWDGYGWCDVHVRVQIGAIAGTTASTVMIIRRLARVMDTRNITVSSSRGSKRRETVWEVLWCWAYPCVLVLVYYVIQPSRYMIFGMVGCISSVDSSWPSVVLNFIWPPITMLVAAWYAVILIYRLWRYRREFTHLVAARNTTKSRFVRLFLICIVVIIIYLPLTLYLLVTVCKMIVDPYDWHRIHDPRIFNTIIKIPSYGHVTMDKWIQVATGYWIFFLFGTGSDAHNLYKQILLAVGLGKFFPTLHLTSSSGSSTPRSFLSVRSWTASLPAKAKRIFWSESESTLGTTSTADTLANKSVVSAGEAHRVRTVSTTDDSALQKPHASKGKHVPERQHTPFLKRVFRRAQDKTTPSLLPRFSSSSDAPHRGENDTQLPQTGIMPIGISTHAWAAAQLETGHARHTNSVQVVQEVHQNCQARDSSQRDRASGDDALV